MAPAPSKGRYRSSLKFNSNTPLSFCAVLVAIDPQAPIDRICEVLAAGQVRCLISSPVDRATKTQLSAASPLDRFIVVGDQATASNDVWSWSQLQSEIGTDSVNRKWVNPVKPLSGDPAYIIFTSGSTGAPKGIVHTHDSGGAYVRLSRNAYSIAVGDRIASHSPLHFDMSLLGYLTAIDAGPETLEIMAEPGSPFVANVAQQPHLIGQTSADNVARYFAGQKLPVQTFIPVVPVKGPQEAKAVYKQLGYGELQ